MYACFLFFIIDSKSIFLVKPQKFKEVVSIKGIYNKGYVKRTNGQIKKHRIQMTDEEILYIDKKIKSMDINSIYLSEHARNNNVVATIGQIKETLLNDSLKDFVVEYNETPFKGNIEHRVLLRDNKSIMVIYNEGMENQFCELSNLCFVLCMDNGKIVTTYYNIINDSHKTLNLNRYDKNLKIIK